jgi:tetratricopeptide (TPR) repeat protein
MTVESTPDKPADRPEIISFSSRVETKPKPDGTTLSRLPRLIAHEYLERGEACRNGERWDQAIGYFTEAIHADPGFAEAYFKRGNMKLRLGRHSEAIADYTEAIRLDATNAKSHNNRGRAYSELRQYDRAITDYDAALRIDPHFAVSYFNRGLARMAVRDFERAIADFDKCIELEPCNLSYRNQLDEVRSARAMPSISPASAAGKASLSSGGGMPHPTADANLAAQHNLEYQQAVERWKALPFWQRLRTKRPEPPTGI